MMMSAEIEDGRNPHDDGEEQDCFVETFDESKGGGDAAAAADFWALDHKLKIQFLINRGRLAYYGLLKQQQYPWFPAAAAAAVCGLVLLVVVFLIVSASGSAAGRGKTIEQMTDRFSHAKATYLNQLQQDYGPRLYSKLFLVQNGITRGRTAFVSPSESATSWNRLVRKLTIKLLTSMTSNNKKIKFVWASGGGSGAAGHGNFLNQSYTAVMQGNLRDVFSAVGLELEGRNYGAGGREPAPEQAFCVQSIYGIDVDVLSWDYSTTDSRCSSEMQLFFYRAAAALGGGSSSTSRPAAIWFPHRPNTPRTEALAQLEARGLPTLYLDAHQVETMTDAIPDMVDLSPAEVEELPPHLRYYKCDGQVETGEPHCQAEKYDLTECKKRAFKTPWNPGWKWHALHGNLMSLLLIELMEDALKEIRGASSTSTTPKQQLEQLQLEDDLDYQAFASSDLPELAQVEIQLDGKAVNSDMLELFYKQPNLCHTAFLPADIRYKGILTTPDDKQRTHEIDPVRLELEEEEELLNTENIDEIPNDGDTIRLVADPYERQKKNCPTAALNLDHNDYFYISEPEGWKELKLPNKLEQQYYYYQHSPPPRLKGVIAVCYVPIWHKQIQGNIIDGITPGSDGNGGIIASSSSDGYEPFLQMTINGEHVTSLAHFEFVADDTDDDCYILQNSAGYKFTQDEQGQFTFRIKVLKPEHYARFSSIVIW